LPSLREVSINSEEKSDDKFFVTPQENYGESVIRIYI
jgi:hypothetical protein